MGVQSGAAGRADRCRLRWRGNSGTGSSDRLGGSALYLQCGTATAEAPPPHLGARPGHIQVAVLTGDPTTLSPSLPHLRHGSETGGQLLRLAETTHFVHHTKCGRTQDPPR